VEAAHALGRLTTAHCRARQSMVNAVEAGLDCIEHAEFLVPGDIAEYGEGIAASGVISYDPRVTQQLLEAGTFVSFTFQAGGYDTLLELRTKREHEPLTPTEEKQRSALERYFEMKLDVHRPVRLRIRSNALRPRAGSRERRDTPASHRGRDADCGRSLRSGQYHWLARARHAGRPVRRSGEPAHKHSRDG